MKPNVAASVRDRLLSQAKEKGEEFERTLTQFVVERLLFRLGASSAGNRCLLKGARLLAVWFADPYRATRDVDILASGRADDRTIRSLVAEICAAPCPEDGLRFDLSELTIETIRPEEEYFGKRARFRAFLGNARIRVQLDIGVSDACVMEPEKVEYPTLLPALPAPRLLAYPRELTIAEKFETMVKLDTRNSRMKDFHDVWALASTFGFTGVSLQRAVAACFDRRGTRLIGETPRVITPGFYQGEEMATRWRRYLAAGAVLVPPPAQFGVIGERIVAFLGPVRQSVVEKLEFDRRWDPLGQWRRPDSKAEAAP